MRTLNCNCKDCGLAACVEYDGTKDVVCPHCSSVIYIKITSPEETAIDETKPTKPKKTKG